MSAPEVEAAVRATLAREDPGDLGDADQSTPAVSAEAFQRVARVVVRPQALDVRTIASEEEPSTVWVVPWPPAASSRKRPIIIPPTGGALPTRPIRSESRARLLEAVAKARAWLDELVSGSVESTRAIAAREGCSERSVRMSLSLAFLNPVIVTAAVEGRLPHGVGVTRLLDLSADWGEQLAMLAARDAPARVETHAANATAKRSR